MRQPHPVKGLIVARGQSLKDAAVECGYSPDVFRNVLNRQVAAWPEFRRRVTEHFGQPEDDLFLADDADGPELDAEQTAAVAKVLRRGLARSTKAAS